MADSKYIVIDPENKSNLGDINISPAVLEVLLGIAASKVSGVSEMRGTLADSILGREKRSKGVTVSYDEKTGKLTADVYVYLKYGVSVPQVALEMQKDLTQQLQYMTEMEMAQVNVHVVGLVTPKTDKQVANSK